MERDDLKAVHRSVTLLLRNTTQENMAAQLEAIHQVTAGCVKATPAKRNATTRGRDRQERAGKDRGGE